MKYRITLLVFMSALFCKAQNVSFTDANFKFYLKSQSCASTAPLGIDASYDYINSIPDFNTDVDTNNDGEIQVSEAESVTALRISGNLACNPCNLIASIQGIEAFTNLQVLVIASQNGIQTINLDGILPNLKYVKIYCTTLPSIVANQLTTINLKNLASLEIAYVNYAEGIQNYTFENLPSLKKLNYHPSFSSTQLTISNFNIINTPNVDFLDIEALKLGGSLNLSGMGAPDLNCIVNPTAVTDIIFPSMANSIVLSANLPTINFSPMTYLNQLNLTVFSYTNAPVVTDINYGAIATTLNKLTLTGSNGLSDYDFSNLNNLTELTIHSGNAANALLFNGLSSLTKLTLDNIHFSNENNMDFALLPNLKELKITGSNLTTGTFTTLNYNGPDNLTIFNIDCYSSIATVSLGTLMHVGDLTVKGLTFGTTTTSFNNLTTANTVSITGVSYGNTSIIINNALTIAASFKVIRDTSLSSAFLGNKIVFTNGITTPYLELKGYNPVFMTPSSVDYMKINTTITSNNPIQTLDFTKVQIDKLEMLYPNASGSGNTHKGLLFSAYTDLKEFIMTSSTTAALHIMDELNFNQQTHLNKLNIAMVNGVLARLLLKNGNNSYQSISLNLNSALKYICYDDNAEVAQIVGSLINVSPSNVNFNTYCTFNPGGEFYTIQGDVKWDSNNNGCDVNDSFLPNFSYSFTDGTLTGRRFGNATGHYEDTFPAGNYTFTPFFENPTYYDASPSSVQVALNSANPVVTQNFCVSPLDHQDLEVFVVPISFPFAGFNLISKILYRNKGNIVIPAGQVTINYDAAILHPVVANPTYNSTASNQLIWDFTNLQPFETRDILLILNLNGPTSTPPVNAGNPLDFSAVVTPFAGDEFLPDNTCLYSDHVVNSHDPNSKTCIEGNNVSVSTAGSYVHYIIHFENLGTANAQNIVVKDMIDTSKFDVNTLIPIDGSHDYTTHITGNKVEFIFKNIQLPFDDANNDGYVYFKIKTLPNLVQGDTFSNSANIYFDYNFPVVTNTYVTTIASLGITDIAKSKFSFYPNPVKDIITFSTKEDVTKIELYDMSGRILAVMTVKENKVNLSELKTGNYIMKVYTASATTNLKVFKE